MKKVSDAGYKNVNNKTEIKAVKPVDGVITADVTINNALAYTNDGAIIVAFNHSSDKRFTLIIKDKNKNEIIVPKGKKVTIKGTIEPQVYNTKDVNEANFEYKLLAKNGDTDVCDSAVQSTCNPSATVWVSESDSDDANINETFTNKTNTDLKLYLHVKRNSTGVNADIVAKKFKVTTE